MTESTSSLHTLGVLGLFLVNRHSGRVHSHAIKNMWQAPLPLEVLPKCAFDFGAASVTALSMCSILRPIIMESKSKPGLWTESQLSSFGLASISAKSGCAGITDRLRRSHRVPLVKGIPLGLLHTILVG